jgi:hypothetical protein
MAISGKPPKLVQAEVKRQPDEQEVRNLIHKGGSVAEVSRGAETVAAVKPMLVQLRLYPDMVQEIDAVRKRTAGKGRRAPSRHAWVVRAIEDKLAKDGGL